MNIQEELLFAEKIVQKARKFDIRMGTFVKILSQPLSPEVEVQLTNGTVTIPWYVMARYRQNPRNMLNTDYEQVASSFILIDRSINYRKDQDSL
jgi:hypothetical protein